MQTDAPHPDLGPIGLAMIASYTAKPRKRRAKPKPQTAEMRIDARENAPVRRLDEVKRTEVWCRAELPDGSPWEGLFAKMPSGTVRSRYLGGVWSGPLAKMPAGAVIEEVSLPCVLEVEVREKVVRPAKAYERRRGLSWLARYDQAGKLTANEHAAGIELQDAWLGSQATLVSGFDGGGGRGGASGGFPLTRLERCAASRRTMMAMITRLAEWDAVGANLVIGVCCHGRSAPAAHRMALAEDAARKAEAGLPVDATVPDERTSIKLLARGLGMISGLVPIRITNED